MHLSIALIQIIRLRQDLDLPIIALPILVLQESDHEEGSFRSSCRCAGHVFAGYAMLALLMTVAYARLVHVKGSPAWTGARFGLIASVCWLMPYSLVLFGVYRFPYAVLPMDFGWALIEQGTGGLIIGWPCARPRIGSRPTLQPSRLLDSMP